MSLVTTPIVSSSPSARQSAATSVLFPDPTGPPIPTRSARSGGKELSFGSGMDERTQLERGREAARQVFADGAFRELVEHGRRVEEPPRGDRGVDRQQPHGRGRDGGRVFVER